MSVSLNSCFCSVIDHFCNRFVWVAKQVLPVYWVFIILHSNKRFSSWTLPQAQSSLSYFFHLTTFFLVLTTLIFGRLSVFHVSYFRFRFLVVGFLSLVSKLVQRFVIYFFVPHILSFLFNYQAISIFAVHETVPGFEVLYCRYVPV